MAGTDVPCCWYLQSREGNQDFCNWKLASRVILGQFSYMLFAFLKSVSRFHVKSIPWTLYDQCLVIKRIDFFLWHAT